MHICLIFGEVVDIIVTMSGVCLFAYIGYQFSSHFNSYEVTLNHSQFLIHK